MKILSFSWNTESVKLCESLDKNVIKSNRSSGLNTSSYLGVGIKYVYESLPSIPGVSWLPCEVADFFDFIKSKMEEHDPDMVVICFQEDAYPGSYFHSHLLPEEMSYLKYQQIRRNKMQGVGITTLKGLYKGEIKLRGLRNSIYLKEKLYDELLEGEFEDERLDEKLADAEYVCDIKRAKGGLASYIRIPNTDEVLAIINVHLPFNSKSLKEAIKTKDPMIRQNALSSSNICFNNIIKILVLDKKDLNITQVILMGDLNYRIGYKFNFLNEQFNNWEKEAGLKLGMDAYLLAGLLLRDRKDLKNYYLEGDELLDQMNKNNIHKFMEGINNNGPMFLPTCKMQKGRSSKCEFNNPEDGDFRCWKTGVENQRNPSWCDRILYKKLDENSSTDLMCTVYDRFDIGDVMKMSDHAGVYAVLELLS